jgi:hypothetical protein
MNEKYLKTKEGSIEDTVKLMQNKVLESDYQDKFKKALDKEGKPLGHMTGAEKKAFFGKVDKMHTAKNEEKDIPKGSHKMPDGTIMKDSEHKKEVKEEDAYDGTPAEVKKLKAKEKADAEKAKAKSKKEDINEANITLHDHDSTDKDFKDLVRKSNLTMKVKSGYKGDNVTLSGNSMNIEKMLKTMYGNDWNKTYKRRGNEYIEAEYKKEEVSETHTTQTAKANRHQKSAGGEKSPISHMVNKSIKEITANDGKTFAQMRAEMDEACWDSHKQVGTKMKGGKEVPNCVPKNEAAEKTDAERTFPGKDEKIKGENPADKGKKEQETGEDTRDPKKKTMSGKVATSPEMNPKVDYKY